MAFCALPVASSPPIKAETIGLRFVIDSSLADSRTAQEILVEKYRRQVANLNEIYRNSLVDLHAEIVQIGFAPIRSNDAATLFEDMAKERGGFEKLLATADEYGADYTIAIVEKLVALNRRVCGKAIAVNKTLAEIADSTRATAVIDVACRTQTLAHEIGHLMGLNHGVKVDECDPGKGHATAIDRHALGYAEGACDGQPAENKFGTIMVGGWMKSVSGHGHGYLPFFSNPRLRDARCGVRGVCGDPKTGDAARTLNEHTRYYAAHESPDVHVLLYRDQRLQDCISTHYRGFEIAEMTELICPSAGIESLEGIEKLKQLKRIDLRNNRIAYPDALLNLPPNVPERIDLSENNEIPCPIIDALIQRFGDKLKQPDHCNR
jgi:hypothetical protein